MYQIALCDDEAAELDKTEQMLNDYGSAHPDMELIIGRFGTAEQLLHMVREKGYAPDVIFMDIYMPEKMGIDAARELRSLGNKGMIIFLTTSRDHALDAFGVDAVQYLVKPVLPERLFPVLDRCVKQIEEAHKRYILLRIEGRIQRVSVSDIVYCEAQGKSQNMYFADGTQCALRMTMAEICEMLSRYREFARAGISYVLNLEHVDSLNAHEVQMDNGRKVYLPRGSYQPLRERYFNFYFEE